MRDKTRKRFLNRGMAFFLALLMVVSLLPVGAQEVVAAGDKSEVTTTLGEQTFDVGKTEEFTVTTVPSDEDANKMVLGHFEITDSEDNPIDDSIMTLEYQETQGAQKDQWFPLSTIGGQGSFGPDSGFPMSDATSNFRVTFKQDGDYTVKISIRSVEGQIELCSTGEIEISAVKKHTVKLECDEGGTATLTAGTETGNELTVEDGEEVKLEVTASKGYQIASVTVNGTAETISDSNKAAFTKSMKINADTTIAVAFVKVYTVAVKWNQENGTVVTNPSLSEGGTVVVEENNSVGITATPKANYRVSKIEINGEVKNYNDNTFITGNPYTTMLDPNKNYTIEITFSPMVYTVSAEVSEHGKVQIENETVEHGGSTDVSIVPEEGYSVKSVKLNDEDVSITQTDDTQIEFTISNITENQTIKVTFVETEAVQKNGEEFFNDEAALRSDSAQKLYVFEKDQTVTFSTTEYDGIRIYDTDGTLIGGSFREKSVEIKSTEYIGKIELYYQAQGEWIKKWHTVSTVTGENPIYIVIDEADPDVTVDYAKANEYGYYKNDVTVSVAAEDKIVIEGQQDSRSGIAKIQYQVTNNGKVTQGKGSGDTDNGILYEYKDGEIQDSVTDEITVDVDKNNGAAIKVTVIVTDRAGNETMKDIDLKMDNTAPTDLSIAYGKTTWWESLLEKLTFGFYQVEAEVTISAADATAGVDFFTYSYIVQDGASSSNVGASDVKVESGITYSTDGKTAEATFKIPAQFRGYVTFTATDRAGNTSAVCKDDKIIVVDNIDPVVDITYDYNNDLNYYYSRTATIEITEANFFEEDMEDELLVITVGKRLNDETVYTETQVTPTFTKEGDVYTATIAFTEDADYTLDISYTDRSGNMYDDYEKDEFTIDTTAPKIAVSYDNNTCLNGNQFKADRTATITIQEHNFNAADVEAQITAVDASGNAVSVEDYAAYLKDDDNWKHDGDVHTATILFTEEANYTFSIAYADLAGNGNGSVDYGTSVAPEKFTIDKTAPTASIQVGSWTTSTSGEAWDHFLDDVSFELWDNKTLAVTVNNDDSLSGVDTIEHFRTDEAMTLAQVEAYEDWIAVNGTNRVFSYNVTPDERFIVYVHIVDKAGNELYLSSDGIILDKILPDVEKVAPEITVQPTQPVNGIYNTDVKMDVQVTDPAASGASLLYSGLKSVTYEVYNNSVSTTEPTQRGTLFDVNNTTLATDRHGLIQTYREDACITVDRNLNNSNDVIVRITATDNAGNVSTATCALKIDITAPTIDISYNNNNADSGTYFKEDRTATIVVHERNFNPADVRLTITNTDGTMPVISGWSQRTGSGNQDDTAWTATVTYAADGDYTFAIEYTDLAGNRCAGEQYAAGTVAPQAFTIDKSLPEISVSYDNNAAENTNYYKEARTATITINEHNFDASRVEITMTATDDGAAASVPGVSGWSSNGDRHTATISFADDALYSLDITVRDMAGNDAEDFAQQSFYVDRTAPALEITGVSDNSANNGDVIPVITYSDTNFDVNAVTITLTGANRKQVTLDGSFADIHNGQIFTFNNFPKTKEMDDIYTLEATLTDRAGNTTTQTIHFSVNRFGSTYAVSQETESLNGSYVQEPVDVVITEVNANELKNIRITLFKNNETITLEEGTDYSITVQGGNGSWYEYTYTIFAENFTDDGVYRITVHSEDAAGNVAENTLDTKEMEISFGVDKTSPNVVITNLESGKTYALDSLTVIMTASDNLLLDSIMVYLDDYDTAYKSWTAEEIAAIIAENGEFTFDISGDSTSAHKVKVVCIDAAGNEQVEEITDFFVTTNLWVRYYNNKPLFYGSIAGVIVLVGAVIVLVSLKKKKKEEK